MYGSSYMRRLGSFFVLTLERKSTNMFVDELHTAAAPIWQKSFEHPFITELVDGSLPIDNYRFYLKQDRYYLEQFGQFHLDLAKDMTDPHAIMVLKEGAVGLKDGEIDIRKSMFNQLKITDDEIKTTPIAPTAYNYVTHMEHELISGSAGRAISALLPCYWLYNEIGKSLAGKHSPVQIYQQFLDSYASDEFSDGTNNMIELLQQVSEDADDSEKDRMKEAFLKSSTYELEFWQMAYTMEAWPF